MATKTTTKKAEPKTTTAKTANVEEAPVKAVAEEPAKKTATKATAKKPAAKKATTAKKPAVRKTTAKKAKSLNTEVYVQFWGREVYAKEVVENIQKIWTDEMGKKAEDLEDLKVYIKPEENGAHYVINGDVRGFIGL